MIDYRELVNERLAQPLGKIDKREVGKKELDVKCMM